MISKLTKREAIRECKRLWKEIEKSGLTKYGFLNSPDGKKWKGKGYWGNCPLCEYTKQVTKGLPRCSICSLVTQYGKRCRELGFDDHGHSLPEWFKAIRGLK